MSARKHSRKPLLFWPHLKGTINEDLKSASRFRFKSFSNNLSSPPIDWFLGVLYMQLIVCAAVVLALCLFLCEFVYSLQFKYFSLGVYVCICVSIIT